jgi:hypothetical protein
MLERRINEWGAGNRELEANGAICSRLVMRSIEILVMLTEETNKCYLWLLSRNSRERIEKRRTED